MWLRGTVGGPAAAKACCGSEGGRLGRRALGGQISLAFVKAEKSAVAVGLCVQCFLFLLRDSCE